MDVCTIILKLLSKKQPDDRWHGVDCMQQVI